MKICEDAKVLASIKRKVFDIYRYRYPPPARACILLASSCEPATSPVVAAAAGASAGDLAKLAGDHQEARIYCGSRQSPLGRINLG